MICKLTCFKVILDDDICLSEVDTTTDGFVVTLFLPRGYSLIFAFIKVYTPLLMTRLIFVPHTVSLTVLITSFKGTFFLFMIS